MKLPDPCDLFRQQLQELEVEILPGEPKNPEHYYSCFEICESEIGFTIEDKVDYLVATYLQPAVTSIAKLIKKRTSMIKIMATPDTVPGTKSIQTELFRVSIEYYRQLSSGPGYWVQYSCLVEEL